MKADRFLSNAESQVRYQLLWMVFGLVLVIFGVYILIFKDSVLFHIDRLVGNGAIRAALMEVKGYELSQQARVLLDAAYNKYLPDVLAMFGSALLGFGSLAILYIQSQKKWLQLYKSK